MIKLSKNCLILSDECYQYIGLVTVLFLIYYILIKLLNGLWTTFLGNLFNFSYKFKPGKNAFAIVTGATDGIGLEYARFFAEKGYNLFIISRNEKKLLDTKNELLNNYPKCKQVITHQSDFKYTTIYEDIKSELQKLDNIEVLVNNVGVSFEYPEYLTEMNDESSWQSIGDLHNINMLSCTRMNQIVLPLMKKNKKGCVLNLSSFSACYPCPLFSVYGASKIFIDHLSRALEIENRKYNIVIQSVLPSFISTKMTKMNTSIVVPSPRSFVRSQLRTVNLERRTYGYWSHKIQGFFADCLINNIFNSNINSLISYMILLLTRKFIYKASIEKNKIQIHKQNF